jgi:tetratricopeptide (TPR) repeat protein
MEEIDALIARADACLTAHETHEAMQQYQQVLALQPQHAHALHRMGIACFRLEQNDRSRQYLDAALSAAPQRADIWEHRGILASATGDLVAAEAFYHRALSLAGSTVTLHRNLADSLRLSNRFAEARLHYSKALELDPGLHHAVLGLARVSSELGQLDEAADYWQRAWALDSTQISDALELITAMSQAGRDTQIDGLLAKLRTRFAGDAAALERLAFAMNSIHRFREAIGVAVQGLAVDPQNAWLHHNASYAFNTLGKFDPMRVHTIEAAELLPDNPRMQFNLAATQLRLGDFERGWKQYRWHEALPENHDLVRPGYPEWQGEPVAGCRFLLVGEQGLGDQLQFLRLADWLHRQGASVDVWVEAPLGELARNAAGVHAAWTTVPPGPYDYWCRMLRMPEHMKLEPSMLPLAMPYLTAAPDDARRWQKRLDAIDAIDDADRSATRRKRIGLVWAGNPAYGLDRFRSIPSDHPRATRREVVFGADGSRRGGSGCLAGGDRHAHAGPGNRQLHRYARHLQCARPGDYRRHSSRAPCGRGWPARVDPVTHLHRLALDDRAHRQPMVSVGASVSAARAWPVGAGVGRSARRPARLPAGHPRMNWLRKL